MSDDINLFSAPFPGVYVAVALFIFSLGCGYFFAKSNNSGQVKSLKRSFLFFARLNSYLVVAMVNASVLAACATNVIRFRWSKASDPNYSAAPTPAPGNQRFFDLHLPDVLFGCCVALLIESIFVSIVAALSLRTTAPFDENYAVNAAKQHETLSVRIQVLTFLAVLVGWLARVPIVQAIAHNDLPTTSPGIVTQFYVICVCGMLEAAMMMLWCLWHTLWRRVDYMNYVCPVCDGRSCEACYDGLVYLNP